MSMMRPAMRAQRQDSKAVKAERTHPGSINPMAGGGGGGGNGTPGSGSKTDRRHLRQHPEAAGHSIYARIGSYFTGGGGAAAAGGGGGRQQQRVVYTQHHHHHHQHGGGGSSSSNAATAAAGCSALLLLLALFAPLPNGGGNHPLSPPSSPAGGSRAGGGHADGSAARRMLAELRVSSLPPDDGTVRVFHAVESDDDGDADETTTTSGSARSVVVRRLDAMLSAPEEPAAGGEVAAAAGTGEIAGERNRAAEAAEEGKERGGTRSGAASTTTETRRPRFEYRTYGPSARRAFLAKYGHLCYDGRVVVPRGGGGSGGDDGEEQQRQREQLVTTNPVLERYDALGASLPLLQGELWKHCMLYLGHGNAYVDADDVVLLRTFEDAFLLSLGGADGGGTQARTRTTTLGGRNWAVGIDSSTTVTDNRNKGDGKNEEEEEAAASLSMAHPSLLIVSRPLSSVPLGMVRLIVETSNRVLESSPLLLPRQLRRLIDADVGSSSPSSDGGGGGASGGKTSIGGGSEGGMRKGGGKKKNEKGTKVGESNWSVLEASCARQADPSSTSHGTASWDGVSVGGGYGSEASGSANNADDQQQPQQPLVDGSLAQQLGPGTHAAISGIPYGTLPLHPQRHVGMGLHAQTDAAISLVHTSETPDANSRRVSYHCTRPGGGYCCEVYYGSTDAKKVGRGSNGEDGAPLLLVRHPVSGHATIERHSPPRNDEERLKTTTSRARTPRLPYLTDLGRTSTVGNVTYSVPPHEVEFMSTVREISLLVPDRTTSDQQHDMTMTDAMGQPMSKAVPTPNFFDILLENDCLPTTKACHSCLKRVRDGKGHDCTSCEQECGCYCRVLCKIRPPEKRVVKEYRIYPPMMRKDEGRLVPRIVHQTWFEPVTKEKYPNMSRLIESWKRSGWEYNFYDDDTAASFLSTHFPPEVREAYESILPGAFKADLFRYCVLLIRGGVYADMDVLLESNLDALIANDVGFMVPMDSPGTKIGRRSCLWNGLMAVAPGHPFLAKTIEFVVNNIRNRFTSVDYDDMLCPNPVFQISHSVDTLFTCGPCILGGSINAVLGRHMQEPYEPGDIDIWATERKEQAAAESRGDTNPYLAQRKKKSGIVVSPEDQRLLIPGRTIILQQNKQDMGAHRFTWAEMNLMVAATDMPDYDDRPPTLVHYSKTHGKAGVYGVKKLYTDNVKADEKIQLVIQKV